MKSDYRPEFIIIIMLAFFIHSNSVAQCNYKNLVVNSDFSDGNSGFSSDYQYCDNKNCLYPEGRYTVGADISSYHSDFEGMDHTSGNGMFLMVNGAGSPETIWSQTITVKPYTEYNFSSWVCSVVGGEVAQLQFSINTDTLGSIFYAPSSVNTWEKFDIMWNSGSSTTAVIKILDQNTAPGGNDFGLDDIYFIESCALAVHFLDISTTNKPSSTELKWSTLSERASNYFEVQRSFDGINFDAIGKVKAKGNSGSIANYIFEDKRDIPGSFYYRVVEIDDEGRQEMSSIVATKEKVDIQVFPNPCASKLNIIFQDQSHDHIDICLVDINGINIPLDNRIFEATSTKMVYELSDLVPGIYFLTIKTESGRTSKKIVIP